MNARLGQRTFCLGGEGEEALRQISMQRHRYFQISETIAANMKSVLVDVVDEQKTRTRLDKLDVQLDAHPREKMTSMSIASAHATHAADLCVHSSPSYTL